MCLGVGSGCNIDATSFNQQQRSAGLKQARLLTILNSYTGATLLVEVSLRRTMHNIQRVGIDW